MTTGAALWGAFPMLVTPFGDDGGVDADDLSRLVEFVCASGAQGVSVLGLGGEVGTLTDTERRAITRLVTERARGLPVIVGCTTDRTARSAALAAEAAELGAAAIMLAPGSRRWTRAQHASHFAAVARACAPIPLMIQDAPAFVGVSLDDDFAVELSRAEPNIRYAKPEVLPAADNAARLASAGLTVFGGHGGLYAFDVLEAGARGLIPGCEAPAEFGRLVGDYVAGRTEDAWATFRQLVPLLALEFQGLDHFIACVKHIVRARGLIRHATLRGKADPIGATGQRLLMDRAARVGLLN